MTSCIVSIALLLTPPPIAAPKEDSWKPPNSITVGTVEPTRVTSFSLVDLSMVYADAPLSVSIETPAQWESTPPISPSTSIAPPLEDTTPRSLTDAQLYRLRMCESTDRYEIDTGNGYFGAYQFNLSTWNGVAERHLPWLVGVRPNHAWPAEQDAMTRWLWSERGRYPWPVCGWRV